MSATITDYFNKASNMSGSYPAVATVTAARSTGGSTLSCDDLSSWATDTPVHFSTFKVNTDGTIDTSTQTDWKGIVNGNTITDMTRLAGAADSGNASGDRVELNPTVGWLDDLITGILASRKQNGALKDNAVTESSIATGAVTNTKLGDGSVTSAKIGTGAISSYDKIGDDVIQARNLADDSITNDKIDYDTVRKVLYEGRTNANITNLADNVEDYDYLEIYYQWRASTGKTRSTKICDTANGAVLLCGGFEDYNNAYFAVQDVTLSGKTVTFGPYMQIKNNWGSSGVTANNSTKYIYITRIVGVKCPV